MPGKETNKEDPAKKKQAEDAGLERLKRDVFRPDMEKFQLFTQMLRRNALFKKAKVSHK